MLVLTVDEISKYIPNNTITNFSFIESFISVAEINEIIPVIGQELYDNLQDAYSGSGEAEVKYTTLLPYVQRPLVYFAFAKAVPILDVKLTENGFGVTSDHNIAPASKDRVTSFREGIEEAAYDGIETLLAFLESNKTTYTEWDSNSAKSHLINNAVELDEYFNTNRSRRLYLKLEPLISRTETFDIAGEISTELLTQVITQNKAGNVSAANNNILNDIKAATAYLSISYAINTLSSDIKFNKIVKNYIIGRSSYVNYDDLVKLKEQFHSMGVQHLMKAKAYILDNVTDFPSYVSSDLYDSAESDPSPGFQNSSDFNHFVFGGYGA